MSEEEKDIDQRLERLIAEVDSENIILKSLLKKLENDTTENIIDNNDKDKNIH
jgi:hypothetical protein